MPDRLAIVLGGAATLRDDQVVLAGLECARMPTFIGVNDGGWAHSGRLDHWVTLHPELMEPRLAKRANKDYELWTKPYTPAKNQRERLPFWDRFQHNLGHWGVGSSGLFAVTVALHLGFQRIVLCGVPMDNGPNVNGNEDWQEHTIHRPGWLHHAHRMGAVRSMSGWTRELLGAPTEAWLA